MRQLTTLIFLFFMAGLPLSLQATHIVGGEMTYKCLGNDQYEIKLTVFRDCFNGIPWFDNPAAIGIFSNETNLFLGNVLVPLDPILNDTIDPTLDDDCLAIPPNVCVNTTTYTTIVELPFITGGYHLAYQRCCRNNTIANLIAPEDVGATYSIVVSEEALLECNTSPVFNEWPPLYLCVNVPFNIDQSAVDDDGDSLVYKLCNPLTGASDLNPQPQPPNPPPYDTVPWLPPYDVFSMINLPPDAPMTIDSETGLLTGTPTILGQFVIGICVEEYRDGQLIGVNRRDYQVNIGDCEAIVAAFLEPELICGSTTVNFINESINASQFEWWFNDPGNPGAMSTEINPTYTYSDYGEYEVVLVAAPGAACVDTTFATVSVQPNSVIPDFSIEIVECLENVQIVLTDLSIDTFSTIESWEWTMDYNGDIFTSTDQHPVFEVTPPGGATITLVATSATGCSAAFTDIIPIKPPLLILDLGPDIMECLLDEIVLDAGPGFATYLWNDGSDEQTLVVTSSGIYSVEVMDECGFIQFDEIMVSLNGPILDIGPDIDLCNGEAHQFSLTGFETYVWTPSDFLSCDDCPNPICTPTSTITYVVEGTTIDGCTSLDTVTVNVFSNVEVIEDAQICEGDTVFIFGNPITTTGLFSDTLETVNGCDSIHTISVAVLPNSFTEETVSICFGESVEIFGVPTSVAGSYEMTFDAENGCDSTHTITLEVFDEIIIDFQTTDVSCNGGEDGTATATATGGTGGFLYSWSNGDTGETTTNLPAGDHSVTVIDAAGCIATATVTINEPDLLQVNALAENVSCTELGSVSANASGGTGSISILWNTGDATAVVDDLNAGDYTVTATDENGCTAVDMVTVSGALGPDVNINVDQGLTEHEPENGQLTAVTSGGTSPFEFEWSNGASTATIDSLPSGQYIVTVTDANGCTAVDTVNLFIAACTGGKIWNDVDRDGCRQGGELGIMGVGLTLNGTDIFGNTVQAVTTSNYIGEYIFENLAPGSYQVTMTIPPDYTLTQANACPDDFHDSDFNASGVGLDIIVLVEGHCCLIIDGGLYDSCINITDPGEICCDQELCGPGNDPDPITSIAPAIGASQVQYKWHYSEVPASGSGYWLPVKDAFGNFVTTAGYDPGPLAVTTKFVRFVKAASCPDWFKSNEVIITVDDDAVAAINEPGPICVGENITFTAAPNDPGATYHWYFGSGATPATSNSQSPTVVWSQGGFPQISLTVTNNGCTSVDYMLIAVSNNPVYCGTAIVAPGNGSFETNTIDKEGFKIYPNPVTDRVQIEWSNSIESNVVVEIVGMEGRIISSQEVLADTYFFASDMSHLNAGIYMLRVRYNDGQQEVFKIVKQ